MTFYTNLHFMYQVCNIYLYKFLIFYKIIWLIFLKLHVLPKRYKTNLAELIIYLKTAKLRILFFSNVFYFHLPVPSSVIEAP